MPLNQTNFLYVEDDPLSRQVMQMILVDVMGAKSLISFEDSNDFIARVKSIEPCPDVVLLDIHVEPLDGFNMLRLLREDAVLKNVKAIALTASVMSEEVKQLKENGFDGAISKPISVTTFPGLIERILRSESIWHIT